jgi:hypothetical protein
LSRGQPGGHQILHLREKGEKNRVSLEVEATGNIKRDISFIYAREDSRRRVLRGNHAKVKAFEEVKNPSKSEKESAKSREERYRSSDQPIDPGPSDFPRPGRSRRSAQERRIWIVRS